MGGSMNTNDVINRFELFLSLAKKIEKGKDIRKAFEDAESKLSDIRENNFFEDSVPKFRLEFNDNLELFKLASLVCDDLIMSDKFSLMIDSLKKIRKKTSDRTERSKKIWADDNEHEIEVRREKRADLMKEATDLIRLYDIALEYGYKEGTDLLIAKLNVIAPDLVRDLSIK